MKLNSTSTVLNLTSKLALKESALPGPVRAAALKPYPGGRIKEAEKVTEGSVIRYKVEVVDHLDDYDVLLTPEGDILYVDH